MFAALACACIIAPAIAKDHDKNMAMMKKWHESVFQKNDTVQDGFISKDEYMAMAGADFLKMDTNKDGKVSKEEFMKAMGDSYNGMMNKGN